MLEALAGRHPGIIGYSEYKKYAVTVPVVERGGQENILFEVRAGSLRRQPGEICFPGGKLEAGEDFAEAAIRETMEALQIGRHQIQMIAPMDVYISPAGQMIMPYLVRLTDYEETMNPSEVEEVFFVPATYFLENEPSCFRNKVYTQVAEDFPVDKIPGGKSYPWYSGWNDVCFYEPDGRVIWGLTARIMKSVAGIIKQINDGGMKMNTYGQFFENGNK